LAVSYGEQNSLSTASVAYVTGSSAGTTSATGLLRGPIRWPSRSCQNSTSQPNSAPSTRQPPLSATGRLTRSTPGVTVSSRPASASVSSSRIRTTRARSACGTATAVCVNDLAGTRNQSMPAASSAVTTRSTFRRRTDAGPAVSSRSGLPRTGAGSIGTQDRATRSRRSGATRGSSLRWTTLSARRRTDHGACRRIRRRGTPSSFRRMSVGGAEFVRPDH
jgi:hypothetical protein